MTPEELKQRYNNDYLKLKKLGEYVNEYVLNQLSEKLGGKKNAEDFLQIPAVPRVKTLDSLTAKAFYRGYKRVDDPYSAISDKVGVRYVVLLERNICTIERIVRDCPHWTAVVTRDYRKETAIQPDVFTYQSVHYIVRCASVADDLQCEVQIPTLLQHAYNAVTHDTTYKSLITPNHKTYRLVARSMALMESTDQLFMQVDKRIDASVRRFRDTLTSCASFYKKYVGDPYGLEYEVDERASIYLYNKLAPLVKQVTLAELDQLLSDVPTIPKQIQKRSTSEFWYSQPIILYAMYVAKTDHWKIPEYWSDLSLTDLNHILLDVGVGSPEYD